jgi:hypothetical protein
VSRGPQGGKYAQQLGGDDEATIPHRDLLRSVDSSPSWRFILLTSHVRVRFDSATTPDADSLDQGTDWPSAAGVSWSYLPVRCYNTMIAYICDHEERCMQACRRPPPKPAASYQLN